MHLFLFFLCHHSNVRFYFYFQYHYHFYFPSHLIFTNSDRCNLISTFEFVLLNYCILSLFLNPRVVHLQGGFLSSEWLNKPQPLIDSLANVSLRKYLPWIQYWGGWDLFQEMLVTLNIIAKKHSVSLSNVAVNIVKILNSICNT